MQNWHPEQARKSGWEPEFDRSRGDLSIDLVRRIVKVADKDVKLSPKEYELLRVLVQRVGNVLTHRFLLKELWDELTDAQYLRVYVRQLRQKIEADPERPQFVLTETGIGYRLGLRPSFETRAKSALLRMTLAIVAILFLKTEPSSFARITFSQLGE